MLVFETSSLGREYPRLLDNVRKYGQVTSPRGERTTEVRPLVLRLSSPLECLVKRPHFSKALLGVEIAQLLAGHWDRGLVETVAPGAAKLMNAYGAYGPRTTHQLDRVIEELARDSDSRRAVVYIGRPDDLYNAPELGAPCTMTWQFFVRSAHLHMHVSMRSWDLTWGLSYDVPCFVAVQQLIANSLHLPLGEYVHVTGSAHIYAAHDIEPQSCTDALTLPHFSMLQHARDAYSELLNNLSADHWTTKTMWSYYDIFRAMIKKFQGDRRHD